MSEGNRTFDDEVRDEVAEAIAKQPLERTLEALVKTHDFDFGDATRFFCERQGPVRRKYAQWAHENANDEGDMEIDATAMVSLSSDGGAYVMGWKWIGQSEAGVTEHEQEQEMAE